MSEPAAKNLTDWMSGRELPRRLHILLGLVFPAIVHLVAIFRLFRFTIDDAFISFRYAKNLARGWGLVFNEGERIEGYTNFLFTCLLAGGVRAGLDPERLAKAIGAASALASLVFVYLISNRIRRLRAAPCIATWLLAGSAPTAAYAVLGLESTFFVALLLGGAWLFLRETEEGASAQRFPWSGLVFALAGLTRPEAPMFVGIWMAFVARAAPSNDGGEACPSPGAPHAPDDRGFVAWVKSAARGWFGRQNLIRLALFIVPVATHLVWRRLYYGAWLPNTFQAKTGSFEQQFQGGRTYLENYAKHAGPFLLLALGGLWIAVRERRRDLGAIAATAVAVLGYILLVGGDWMPMFRFLTPFEPFCFLLICVSARAIVEQRRVVLNLAVGVLAIYTAWSRGRVFRESQLHLEDERRFWTSATGGVADWFAAHGEPGTIAIADMGYVSYATDYPILDLLGLVDPVIAALPGGYTRKTGPGYVERVFSVMPRYFVFVGGADSCYKLPFASQSRLLFDPRFRAGYHVAAEVKHSKNGLWCVYERGGPLQIPTIPAIPKRGQ